ncbi:hypothetical protein H4Q26_013035 [Puccinia striiformis f. sp. tritici PST-130]|nr:hypothetical protein H4Q26_013035 [Puccinia striiformis f. sp. tritici PST-130]
MKAPIQEMVGNFSSRLKYLGIQVGELTGDRQMTKDQITMTQIIVTIPEKWDVITRKSTDTSYTDLVVLITDKICHATNQRTDKSQIRLPGRIFGYSAQLCRVAPFLRVNPKKGLFFFDSSDWPCPLKLEFIGITEKKAIKRLQLTNEICYDKAMKQLDNNSKSSSLFISEVILPNAKNLKETSIERDEVGKYMSGGLATREILMETAENVRDPGLKDILQFSIGIHHTGLERVDRRLVKELFADRYLQVLVSTATLAWGMLGRAGRPQYNTYGEGIIITNHSELQSHLSITKSQLPIESQLVRILAGILNAEIVLGTIRNQEEAAQWLGYTYWYQCALKHPSLYGFQHDPDDPLLLQKLPDIVHTRLLYYYVTSTSMSTYNQHLRPTMTLIKLFRVFAASDEFKYVPTRPEEKQELAKLLEKVPIPFKESVGNPSAKINITLRRVALMADMVYTTQSAGLRALFEICLKRGWAQ